MPLDHKIVEGYGALRPVIEGWKASAKGRLVLLFLSDHVDGKGWCPDCVTVEPLLEQALADPAVAEAEGITFVTAFVGQKEAWKDKSNEFRTAEDLAISSIPTLLEYGNLEKRLGDKECTSVDIIKNFILGK